MIQETGIIESIDGKYAFIRAERTGTCEHCSTKGVCHPAEQHGGGKEYVLVQTINEIGAKEGDKVMFETPASTFLKISFLIYAIPVFALLIGSFVGRWWHGKFGGNMSPDGASAIFAFIFLIASIIIVKIISNNTGDDKYFPKVVEIIG